MKVIDKGHIYTVAEYDGSSKHEQEIDFMKRVGPKYPGNNLPHAGTNCQELIRVLIDRVKYLDSQDRSNYNRYILASLRQALWDFEQRAAERHGRKLHVNLDKMETYETCSTCGHVQCGGHK